MKSTINWADQTIMITGHTGFKGAWLSLLLRQLGACVHGYALNPSIQPNLFTITKINSVLASDTRADLMDLAQLKFALQKSQPAIIFHLAAQSLVRESYRNPLDTLNSNVIGTVHLLEAAREIDSIRAIIVVTTDKVYENNESENAYSENDPLGGHDIYSASKAAAEIITASYRRSFFNASSTKSVNIATARAGNVFGGGDWAMDRLIPDCIRSFQKKIPVQLRFPNSVRPWQHVLEPLRGYLQLAEKLLSPDGKQFSHAWNFGPDINNDLTVGTIANTIARLWGKDAVVVIDKSKSHPHEAHMLQLNSKEARKKLHWKPRWEFEYALQQTVSWYKAWQQDKNMFEFCNQQIQAYMTEKEYAKSI
ncbi:MAG: CDP-glucose 4,6-dehydratase [uncultured bacterium]|nr:MAG: CDP-glucose 4,6-dehydratase [uncultured bacterium]OGT25454.1 MAG: CDP-glucose 4,6-dehydratase [Gammaproteobacteria bacterium RIFCSPHIGHO2_02_FULL_42_43]OGT27521.1 MAG: CDP-glucose 4,6-dehydratase [Gammaproteobacteria bacterium RIFCSPHIGHO2_01_FULL_42_8]OGT51405.1 MAG: CDP-glucose 4,6-dehydratase [Gammaproteobacteria bacterium RIFCSPHIGHO2_12_FULL_41_25]OGT62107.1 MAG: CDP-glucose 4,6-dehydratase [Gammaproteobacteria bacterium RIFCSPLOWO2_02_FULL_42_14]OGT85779.1 MAG: CDP-glucose 4,6-de